MGRLKRKATTEDTEDTEEKNEYGRPTESCSLTADEKANAEHAAFAEDGA